MLESREWRQVYFLWLKEAKFDLDEQDNTTIVKFFSDESSILRRWIRDVEKLCRKGDASAFHGQSKEF